MTLQRARVLMAWEHGRNLGHIARLTATARLFERAGAQIVWALPDGYRAPAPFDACGHALRSSSRVAVHAAQRIEAPQSFADILTLLGFADPAALGQAVTAWIDLFDANAIDRVVLDYAPVAQLAALVAGLPTHQITNGFDAPPPDCPVFGIGMRGPMLEQRNRQRVEALNGALCTVGTAAGLRRNLSLRDWLAYPARWYDCIAETDPYGPRDDGTYIGPVGQPPEAVPVEWPGDARGARRVFVYLRSASQAGAVLQALSARAARVICAWPGAPDEAVATWMSGSVTIVNRPVDLSQVLPQCDAVVNYGSTTLVCQALLAGKPQLMLPADVEKWLVARRVHSQGAGVALGLGAVAADIGIALERLLDGDAMASRAGEIGVRGGAVHGRLGVEIARCGAVAWPRGNLLEERCNG